MKTIITYGTFDLFHVGHVKLLKRLSQLGDRLVIGLSSDDFNQIKGKQVVIPYEQRKEVLLACRYVDDVFAENSWEQKREDIIREKADIFAMGDDWSGHFDYLSEIVDVIYLSRTDNISTTDLKTVLSNLEKEKISEIKNTCQNLYDLIKNLS
ncbi:adenylyltransferase/cytidyltransferase family protein [Alteromonas abrolhosensis]|uniref:adenylyltransferase/cytidyltransferase family protein n=1 Tax=Alteromonas abrolhosensis TaxID=1892904 RepID=UPI00096BCDC3|nr:adenylyltransferase/cytidyltransferase family protein [Alteromonas abrolhosensis]